MMRFVKIFLLIFALIPMMMLTACRSHTISDTVATGEPIKFQEAPVHAVGYGQHNLMPKAVIYKTNGNFNNNVMVNVNADRSALVSYPAISDVNANSAPIDLGDGWLLDRRGGIGANSVFITYTYNEYSNLAKQPSQRELLAKVIPGSGVTALAVLPITFDEALANPEAVKKYITK